MEVAERRETVRRPRFRRASEPPAFRLTDGDVEIIRQVARHRFISSAQIAALVGRSIDRTNDRLLRLYHAGYVDRPRAQLDRFPTAGLGRMIYALANSGAQLLRGYNGAAPVNIEWARKNREARYPFIAHQTEIVEFRVAMEHAARQRGDVRFIGPDEILAGCPEETRRAQNPFSLRAKLAHRGATREIGVVPDLVFALKFPDGSRRCFMVEIDRGTMPVVRSDLDQTSFERKMRVYLTAHAAGQHQRQLGWKTFRVLTITTDRLRVRSMTDALQRFHVPNSLGPSLFLFTTFDALQVSYPLGCIWKSGAGPTSSLV